jgi:hypothetical protein
MTNEGILQDYKQVPPVRLERSGWRDEWMSIKHRDYGWDAPFVDIDFMGIEYNYGKPVALIEYKHYNANVYPNHPSIKAQVYLADAAKIPHWIVIYYPEDVQYYLIPTNEYAKNYAGQKMCFEPAFWSEMNFVKLLYHLRKSNIPAEIAPKMNKKINLDCPFPKIHRA